MRVGILLVDRDRFVEARNRLGVTVERLQGAAAVVPAPRMPRRLRQRAVEGRNRVGITVELEQRRAAIVQGFGVVRRQHEDRIEIGERLRVAAKPGERGAAIEQALRRGADFAPAPRRNRKPLPVGDQARLGRCRDRAALPDRLAAAQAPCRDSRVLRRRA